MNHSELIEDVKEISNKYVIIQGVIDIIKKDILYYSNNKKLVDSMFKSNIKDSYWILIGNNSSEEMIEDCFEDYTFDVDREGEYFFESVLRYHPCEYDDGRCIMRDYLDVEYINLTFQQSFEEREREFKLNEILDKEFDQLFNIK
jgi:hypothetical protein